MFEKCGGNLWDVVSWCILFMGKNRNMTNDSMWHLIKLDFASLKRLFVSDLVIKAIQSRHQLSLLSSIYILNINNDLPWCLNNSKNLIQESNTGKNNYFNYEACNGMQHMYYCYIVYTHIYIYSIYMCIYIYIILYKNNVIIYL